jgi:hypothetical protein
MAVRFPAGAKIYLFATAFRLAMGFIWLLSNGSKGQERLKLYLHNKAEIHSGL